MALVKFESSDEKSVAVSLLWHGKKSKEKD